MQPYKPHVPDSNHAQAPAAFTPHTSEYAVLYRAGKKKKPTWEDEAVLYVSPRGNATLKNTDGEIIGSRTVPDGPALNPGTTFFVGKWQVEVQGEVYIPGRGGTTAAARPDEQDLLGDKSAALLPSAVRMGYRTPVQGMNTAQYEDICEQCKSTDEACDGKTPCDKCLKTDHDFCCYLDTTCAIMLRHRASSDGQCHDKDDPQVCENCLLFHFECQGATNGPCLHCMENGRAFCTTLDPQDGTVRSVLCAAFRIIENVNGTRSVARRSGFEADPNEVWPSWPRAKPNAATFDGLCDRWAKEDSGYKRHSAEDLMRWYRSGACDLPSRMGRY